MGEKLTVHQLAVLRFLAGWDIQRDGPLTSPEVSRVMGHRTRDWARAKLNALESKGYVAAPMTNASAVGRVWFITPKGRAALTDRGQGEGSDG